MARPTSGTPLLVTACGETGRRVPRRPQSGTRVGSSQTPPSGCREQRLGQPWCHFPRARCCHRHSGHQQHSPGLPVSSAAAGRPRDRLDHRVEGPSGTGPLNRRHSSRSTTRRAPTCLDTSTRRGTSASPSAVARGLDHELTDVSAASRYRRRRRARESMLMANGLPAVSVSPSFATAYST